MGHYPHPPGWNGLARPRGSAEATDLIGRNCDEQITRERDAGRLHCALAVVSFLSALALAVIYPEESISFGDGFRVPFSVLPVPMTACMLLMYALNQKQMRQRADEKHASLCAAAQFAAAHETSQPKAMSEAVGILGRPGPDPILNRGQTTIGLEVAKAHSSSNGWASSSSQGGDRAESEGTSKGEPT